ncbi:MAG: hypothetical protein QOD63_1368 [Actinomycetota bacterium]|nr:hypothetical protein [Actinomycetota bacterium]
MTDGQGVALLALLGDVCTSADAPSLADRWGRSEPSRRRPRGVRVVCDPSSPFDFLEIRPWTDDVSGVVEIELRAGEPPLAWSDVRDRFGPFRAQPRLHGSEQDEYAATWSAPGAAAAAFLVVGVTGDRVDSVTVRRDPV